KMLSVESTSSPPSPSRCRSRSSASCSAWPTRTGRGWAPPSGRSSPRPRARRRTSARSASDAVVGYLRALVETKQATPADDLVSGLITARDGDHRLSQQELLSTILQLIIAGHDTTTSLIGNATVALLRNPDQLAAVGADPSLLPAAIEELLRYDAPVPHSTFRYARAPVELGGVTIPAGAQVIVCLASANRD